jgi:hypothetical protein
LYLDAQWDALQQLHDDLEQARLTTLEFQARDLTAGAMLGKWELLEEKCRQRDSVFCRTLLQELGKRKTMYIQEPAFLGERL